MKKLLVFVAALCASASINAKSLRELWVSMPDSLAPALNHNMRIEFADLQDMGVKPEVKNLLGENAEMDTLTTDFMQLASSPASTLQIKLLPYEGNDSILCMVRTFAAPEKESEVSFYNQHWERMPNQLFFDKNVETLEGYLLAKPDTMSEEKYQGLISAIEPRMFYANLSQKDNSIVFQLSLPLVSKEEKTQLNALLMQRKLKWNGKTFNEI